MSETITKNSRRGIWLDVLRILLGLIIVYKAINFIRNTAVLKSLIEETGIGVFSQNSTVLSFVIAYLSLLFGVFITVGLFTRASSIILVPVLIVAVFFVNIKRMNYNAFEFILSVIALILLILFAIKGSGTLSADEYFRRGSAVDKKSGRAFK